MCSYKGKKVLKSFVCARVEIVLIRVRVSCS